MAMVFTHKNAVVCCNSLFNDIKLLELKRPAFQCWIVGCIRCHPRRRGKLIFAFLVRSMYQYSLTGIYRPSIRCLPNLWVEFCQRGYFRMSHGGKCSESLIGTHFASPNGETGLHGTPSCPRFRFHLARSPASLFSSTPECS